MEPLILSVAISILDRHLLIDTLIDYCMDREELWARVKRYAVNDHEDKDAPLEVRQNFFLRTFKRVYRSGKPRSMTIPQLRDKSSA